MSSCVVKGSGGSRGRNNLLAPLRGRRVHHARHARRGARRATNEVSLPPLTADTKAAPTPPRLSGSVSRVERWRGGLGAAYL
jgi:hypothetical protein